MRRLRSPFLALRLSLDRLERLLVEHLERLLAPPLVLALAVWLATTFAEPTGRWPTA